MGKVNLPQMLGGEHQRRQRLGVLPDQAALLAERSQAPAQGFAAVQQHAVARRRGADAAPGGAGGGQQAGANKQ